jgi:hypothetical protein
MSLGTTMVAAALAAVVVMPTAFGSLAAPWPPIAGGDASATLDGSPAGAAPRIYDPPAGTLTARVVTILAGDAGLDRRREARALTFLPAATDRSEVERARCGPSRSRDRSPVPPPASDGGVAPGHPENGPSSRRQEGGPAADVRGER